MNRGPLYNVVLALFGNQDSYLATNNILMQNYTEAFNQAIQGTASPLFPQLPPMEYLFNPLTNFAGSVVGKRASFNLGPFRNWLNYLYEPYYVKKQNNAFTAAVFLANQAWMLYNVQTLMGRSLTMTSDPGVDTDVPVISTAGIIIISILWVIYLTALLAMSAYAYYYPRWTDTLDAFAMMRLGATIADKVPLLVTYRSDRIQALDEVPGWIGEAEKGEGDGEEEDIAGLELGSHRVLRAEGRYACYPGDDEPFHDPRSSVRRSGQRQEYESV